MRARKNGKEANGHVPTEITDPTDIKIIGVYLVQTLGHPSLDEILEVCRNKIKCEIHPHLMEAALKGAQKQGFVATGSKRNTQNQTVTSYTMKNLIWKQPPEYAHILDLLPVLLHTVRRSEWKAFFDEKEGRGERKKRRGNDIDDYHAFRVKIVTLDPLLGSQISCAFTAAEKAGPPGKGRSAAVVVFPSAEVRLDLRDRRRNRAVRHSLRRLARVVADQRQPLRRPARIEGGVHRLLSDQVHPETRADAAPSTGQSAARRISRAQDLRSRHARSGADLHFRRAYQGRMLVRGVQVPLESRRPLPAARHLSGKGAALRKVRADRVRGSRFGEEAYQGVHGSRLR